MHFFGADIETFFDATVFFGHDETDLLDGRELPVEGACLGESTAEAAAEVPRGGCPVPGCAIGVLIVNNTLEVR